MTRLTATLAALVAVTISAASLTDDGEAADRVYWTNLGTSSSISYANLDGSGEGGTLDSTGATPANAEGTAFAMAQNRVYWAGGGRISYSDLSGGGGDLNTGAAPIGNAKGVAVDPIAGLVYWADTSPPGISFARLDGGGGGALNTTGATVGSPIGLAVDPAAGRIYWSNAGAGGKISYARLDGSGGGDINTGLANVDNPQGVALDPAAGRIYWANVYGQKISYANLDGSGGGDLNTLGATVSNPVGVAVDPAAGRIYWGNVIGQKISYANLDGSGGADLTTTGATLNFPSYPSVVKTPVGTGAPQITATTQGLSCSRGSWAADLVASFAYRSPASYAYRWSVGTTVIPGATSSTYTPVATLQFPPVDAEYRCAVTATNPAGSATQTSPPHLVKAPPLVKAPLLTMLAIRPRAFLATGKRPGARVRFALDEAATVTFKVQRRLPGRAGKGACVKPKRSNRDKQKCTRPLGVPGTFSWTGFAGDNSFRFNGRIQGRRLKPGKYNLLATPTAAGRTGPTVAAFFKVKRPSAPSGPSR
jgi:DNA-binding beta-propeller fold protein YncE